MQTLRTSTPTAKKPHECYWCYGPIEVGDRYHRSTNIGDDGLYEWIACAACDALCPTIWDWAYRPDEGIGEDSFNEWARDHENDPEHGVAARAYLERRTSRRPLAARVGHGEENES